MTETTSASDGKIHVPLSKAIPAHGEDIKELAFREPTGGDITRCGNPVKFNLASADPEPSFDEVKMTAMMAALAGVPPSSIAVLTSRDWMTCAWMLSDFFAPDLATLSRRAAG
ncbi:MAG TPA: phage tail assembly protein [Kaistia sp.]|nr:phage tail assembly protein [Kaistia sp.]